MDERRLGSWHWRGAMVRLHTHVTLEVQLAEHSPEHSPDRCQTTARSLRDHCEITARPLRDHCQTTATLPARPWEMLFVASGTHSRALAAGPSTHST
ncbi:hypothetical protein BKA66DRAFT_462178 [Pyrenochaeta sp. MPI-SDFR-AT-0127]|nr:hypothetical protein BKA66DRAFT_462178 [Pyrenochaeta sp. MPI-SDFR-AT-0127]